MRALAVPALLLSLAAHAGEVTLIRPSAFIGAESTYYVALDGQAVRDLDNREHVRFEVPAGRHALAVRCPKTLSEAYAETKLEHDFGPAAVFFVVEPKFDCVTLSIVDARAAAPLIARTRLHAQQGSTYDGTKVEASAAVETRDTVAISRDDPSGLTAAWVDAYNSRDPARIAALYDPQAVLIGMSAKQPAAGSAAIAAYFRDVASRPTARVALGEHGARVYGDTAIDSGLYTFFEAADASATLTPARYTLVYRKRGGKWLIVEHHSSRVP